MQLLVHPAHFFPVVFCCTQNNANKKKLVQSGQVLCTQKKLYSLHQILNCTNHEFRPLQIQLQFFCMFFQESEWVKVIVQSTVQIGSFRPKASKNIIYFFSMNFTSILTPIPSKCQEFTLLCEYEKRFCKFGFI